MAKARKTREVIKITYQLLYHPQAVKKMKQLHPNDQKRLFKKLDSLCKNPQSANLDIKKLAGTNQSFRIRTGDVRAIFELDRDAKIIYVWDIDYRGNIY